MNVLIKVPVHGGSQAVIGSEQISSMRLSAPSEVPGVVVTMASGERLHVVVPDAASQDAQNDPLMWLHSQIASITQARLAAVEAAKAVETHRAVGAMVARQRDAAAATALANGLIKPRG